MTPSQLLNDDVAIEKDLPDVHRMVTTYLVVRHSFVFTRILVIEELVIDFLLKRSEF